MRFVLCAIAILSLWISQAPAQTAVLIGLHLNAWDDDKGMHPPSYRTFLITFGAQKAQVAADIPDLIVPRKTGFWRVGCLHKGPPRDGGYQEFVYASPARSVPRALGEYHPENPDFSCSQTDEATVEFVNPHLMSVSYMHAPGCSLESERKHATYELDEPEKALEITAVLGPAAWAAQKRADAIAKAEIAEGCLGVSAPDSTNWGIERSSRLFNSSTRPWVLVSDFSAPHVCNGGDTYEIKFPIPESITGTRYHTSTLLSLLKSAKGSVIHPDDALLTPAGDFLVAFGDFSYDEPLRIFRVKQHAIEAAPILSVSTGTNLSWGFNVAMVQWALGKHVGQWESDLKSMAARTLPEPTVATGDPQK